MFKIKLNKNWLFPGVGLVLISVLSCFSLASIVTQADLNRVQPGMSKMEVSQALGGKPPSDKGYKDGKEFWYFDIPVGYQQVQAKQVVFVDGQVVGIEDSPERQKIVERRIAQEQARQRARAAEDRREEMSRARQERDKTLYGQTCIRGNYSRRCPNSNQICVVERSGDSQGICTIPCGDIHDCGTLKTNVPFLSCVDIRGGTRACWKK